MKIFFFIPFLQLTIIHAQDLPDTVFFDDFETDKSWGIYEEIVGGDTCYATGIGAVARSDEYAFNGTFGLQVCANKLLTNKSNHVLGNKQISNTGLHGYYSLSCYAIIPQSADSAQTGPEFSMQSTRNISGNNLTFTAGIQYVQNPWIPQKWWIWHNADWTALNDSILNVHLEKNHWYYLQILFDNDIGKYLKFSIKDCSDTTKIDSSVNLIAYGFSISGENKGFLPASWITLEGENLWTTCSRPVQAKIFYDNVCLSDTNTVQPFSRSVQLPVVKIYPNPVRNRLTVETTSKESLCLISDIHGRELIKMVITDSKAILNLGSLSRGVYTIKVINDLTIEVRKIIKE